jgi:hypothetical protein
VRFIWQHHLKKRNPIQNTEFESLISINLNNSMHKTDNPIYSDLRLLDPDPKAGTGHV